MSENWRPVVGHPGYEVSDMGRVRSLDRIIEIRGQGSRRCRGRVLRGSIGVRGYPVVRLGHIGDHYVHTLVLEAFAGPRPAGQEARHRNGVRVDVRAVNLEWGTSSENNLDQVRHGTHHAAAKDRCPRDHPLQEPNLRLRERGRTCLACSRGWNIANHRREPERWGEYADAYYEEIAGRGVGALLALGVNPRRLLARGAAR